jgi:hypothetical protein
MNITSVLIAVGVILLLLGLAFWLVLAAIIFVGAATYADAHDEDFEDDRNIFR